MRIVDSSPDLLVLDIRPIALMIVCAGLFLLFLLLGFGLPAALPAIASLFGVPASADLADLQMPGMHLLGYASVIPLLVGVFLIKARRLSFDRTTGLVTLATRGVLGHRETTYPLSRFRGASVVRNRSSGNNSTTYTAILHFDDQTVPVTPYGTGGKEPGAIAEAINGWLGPRGGPNSFTLTGEDAAEALQALEKLGIKLPR